MQSSPSLNPSLLSGYRVLVVEDDYFIASDISKTLRASGATIEGPHGSLGQFTEAIGRGEFQLAVIDINLRGEDACPLLHELEAMGVPFVFATGYTDAAIPPEWRQAPLCEKPFRDGEIVAALFQVAAQRYPVA